MTDLPADPKPGQYKLEIKSGGFDRTALAVVPKGYKPGNKPPLVLVLQGAGRDGAYVLDNDGWAAKADKEGFLAVAPNRPHQRRRHDPPARGRVVQVVRRPRPGRRDGRPVGDPKSKKPLSTLSIIGTNDPLLPLASGEVKLPWGYRTNKPAAEYLTLWAKALGCEMEPKAVSEKDGGPTLSVITIDGQGHVWPGGKATLLECLQCSSSSPHAPGPSGVFLARNPSAA